MNYDIASAQDWNESGTGILWVAMLFGFKAAPLVMGRLSAIPSECAATQTVSLCSRCSTQLQTSPSLHRRRGSPELRIPAVSKGAVRLGSVVGV